MATKRGRPRGVHINPAAVEWGLARLDVQKQVLCRATDTDTGHLASMLHQGKGTSEEKVDRMAAFLGLPREVVAPELWRGKFRFVVVIGDDADPAEVA